MTTDPTKLVDSEGEELSLNKVDKALKSIGISLQDTNGQFRNFDDVILELASKWDTLDTNAQRYIATVMAGNRQQSRFLAMVGNYERLAELTEEAANSEDAALIQQLKTMDSLQAKMNQLKVTFQEFYTSTGIEDLIKWTVDGITNIISRLNDMPKVFGKLPVAALATIVKIISGIKAAGNALGPQVVKWFTDIKSKVQPIGLDLGKEYGEQIAKGIESKQQRIQNATENALRGNSSTAQQAAEGVGEYTSRRATREEYESSTLIGRVRNWGTKHKTLLGAADIAGTVASGIGTLLPENLGAGVIDDAGTALAGLGSAVSGIARIVINPADITGWISAFSGVTNLIDGLQETLEEKIDRLDKETKDLNDTAALKKNDYTTLKNSIEKINALKEAQFDSAEAAEEYRQAMQDLANTNPELVSGFDTMGNAIVEVTNAEEILAESRKASYDATIEAAKKEVELSKARQQEAYNNLKEESPLLFSETWAQAELQTLKSYDKQSLKEAQEDVYYELSDVSKQAVNRGFGKERLQVLAKDSPEYFRLKQYLDIQEKISSQGENANVSEAEIGILEEIVDFQQYAKETELQYEDYETIIEKVRTFLEENPYSSYSEYLTGILDSWDGNAKESARIFELEKKVQAVAQKREISAVLGKNFESSSEFFSESNELFSFLQGQIFDDFLSSGEDSIETYINSNLDSISNIVDSYSAFWTSLGDRQTEFQKLLNEASKYTLTEYQEALKSFGLTEDNDVYLQAVTEAEESQKVAVERYTGKLGQLGLGENEIFTSLSEKIAWGLLDNVTAQIEQAQKISPDVTSELEGLYQTASELTPEAESIIANADLFSLIGYIEMLHELEKKGIDTEKVLPTVDAWFENISINLETEFNTFGKSVSEKIKEMGDALDKATSGMNLEEAMAFSQSLGISLTDLSQKDGKFFYNNLEAIKNHYLEEYESLKAAITNEKENQIISIGEFARDINNIASSGEDIQNFDLPEEIKNLYSLYYDEWKNLEIPEGEVKDSFASYIIKQITKAHEENVNALDEYSKSMLVRSLITIGSFKEALSYILPKKEVNSALAAIESGNIENLSESTQTAIAPYIGLINESVKESIEQTWDMVAGAFESNNGIISAANEVERAELLKLADYKELDGEGNVVNQLIKQIGDADSFDFLVDLDASNEFITDVLKVQYGDNYQAMNEMAEKVFSAKRNRGGSTAAVRSAFLEIVDGADNIEEEALSNLATRLGVGFDKLKEYLDYDELEGKYSISAQSIQQMQTDFGIAVTAEIEDALADYFNKVLGFASSAISGSATHTEIESLQKYLDENGANLELKTFKTAEGLKLTEESVYQVYSALSQIDSIAAKGLLEDISGEMEEWEGHSIDVATAYGKIKETQKEIEELSKKPGNEARIRAAKEELAVWEQIAAEKAKDEDNFDFMSQDIGDLNNPLTFYESSAKAFEALGEATSTGYMEVEAYVNMLRFMGNMLDVESQQMALGGKTAAEAIQLGMSALKGVDGELKVDLAGLDFGISGLTEGMEGGIEEMAKSQIEWIDAQIAMLRGLTMLDTVDNLETSADQNVVLDYMDSFIGDFKVYVDELNKEVDLTELFKIKEWSPEQIVTFFNDILAIIESNDPATAREKIANYIKEAFNIKPEDLKIGESDNEELRKVIADGFAEKLNIENWEADLGQDKTQEVVDGLAKMLGIDENNSLLKLLQAKIKEAGGSLSLNEIIEWFAANGVFTVGEDGKLTLDMEATIEMRQNKSESEQNGVRTESLLDTDTPNYTTGENVVVTETTVTSDVAKVNAGEIQFTTDKEEETPIPEEIDKAASSLKSDLSPAIEGAGQEAQEASQPVSFFGSLISTVKDKAKKAASNVRSFSSAVANTSSLQTKYNVLAKIVEQLNKLPTTQRYVGTASASGNVTTPPSSNLDNSWDLNGDGIVNDYEEYLLKEKLKTGAKGNALAAGTLMGELGPELVVSGGRYYVVGQNGAEFVNLPSDAIVFNHLQTKRLLESGHINSTGDPVTNERNAVAWATGNVNGGPAMASASDVIAQLLELRAFWQGILEMSAQDFAKAGGGGKGGGGGGEDNKAYVADLERWYNLLRQIANLEQKITLEQAKRQNMLNGYDYVDSLENELDQLKRQEKAYRDLSALQKSYYDTRRQDLLNSDYSKIFTYTSDGLMQYHEGENIGFDILAKLQELDANGQMKMNATEQLAYLESIGFDTSVLKVTKEGEDVDSETEMVQNFFDNVQAWMDELDGLYDSYNEALINVEEAIAAQNAIQQEYIDNQLSLEQQVLTAIIDREQAAIDAAQDEIDAIQEASDNFINGLNDTLKREKDMYQTNNEQAETERLQRQLAILQRSGGSASEIRALEEQLESRYQDAYFDSMQDEIDAIQAASENQIEKLQEQVDIAVEALEYQKANGLLWNEVYEIMNNWDANAITQFVMEFTKAFKEQSALQNQEQAKETLMSAEKWDAAAERQKQTEMWDQYFRQAMEQYGQTAATNAYSSAKAAYDKAYQATEGTVEQKHAAGMAAAKIEFEKSKAEIDRVTSGVSNGGGGNSSGETYPYGKVSEISRKETNVLTHEGPAIATIKYALKKLGYYKGEINEKYGTEVYNALVAFQKANKINADGIVGEETKKAFKLKGYSLGGLVDYTGLAMVHGTPQKPESYLNAEQTQELRNLLDEARTLNNVSHSISNLNRLRQAWQTEFFNQISSKEQSHQDAGDLIFEDVDINITSGVINNQAEAAQLGRTMWNEFINVAKKTGNLTLSRR